LIELLSRTPVAARVEKALRYLASKGRPGTPIWINTDLDFPAVGAENKDEFATYLVHLDREEGMIRALVPCGPRRMFGATSPRFAVGSI
jgi:hypothetical protein